MLPYRAGRFLVFASKDDTPIYLDALSIISVEHDNYEIAISTHNWEWTLIYSESLFNHIIRLILD